MTYDGDSFLLTGLRVARLGEGAFLLTGLWVASFGEGVFLLMGLRVVSFGEGDCSCTQMKDHVSVPRELVACCVMCDT